MRGFRDPGSQQLETRLPELSFQPRNSCPPSRRTSVAVAGYHADQRRLPLFRPRGWYNDMSTTVTLPVDMEVVETEPIPPLATSLRLLNRGRATRNVPVTTGLCLPRGLIKNPDHIIASTPDGEPVTTQAEVSATWPDGSARWVLLSFVAPRLPVGKSTWSVGVGRVDASRHSMPAIEVTDGALALLLGDTSLSLSFPLSTDRDRLVPTIGRPTVRSSRVRTVTTVEGAYANGLNLRMRLEQWRDCPHVRLSTTLHNPQAAKHAGGLWDLGDPGSILFDEVTVKVLTGQADEIGWCLDDGDDLTWTDTRDRLTRGYPFSVLQASSGHEDWQNSNHVSAKGRNETRFRGFRAETPQGQKTGLRAQPAIAHRRGDATASVSLPEFWQQFPSFLGTSGSSFFVGLFPGKATGTFELQGGEQKTFSFWLSATDEPRIDVVASMDPAWIEHCRVLPWFSAETTSAYDKLKRFLSEALDAGTNWKSRREAIDEYGWRNFGDVHADHEQQHCDSDGTVVSHYNNQYDMVLGGIQHFARTGDATWLDFLDPLSRHLTDIDIYHTDRDRVAYNGGLFWHTDHYVDARTATHRTYSSRNADGRPGYGGGMSCEHNYTTGLLFHHYLTGDVNSRAAVLELAEWVFRMEDGTRTVFSLVDDGDTGLASCTMSPDFHGPGRGPGNSINAVIDAWSLTNERRYIDKAVQLMHRVVHPSQDLHSLHLLDSEGHWSYTVFLIALARLLELKIELSELDADYAYGRAAMRRYGRFMAEHEKPALSAPAELEYVTDAWPAQDFRKANALRLCAWFEDDSTWVMRMRTKADELSGQAWQDLYSFDTRYNARVISILMTEGLREAWHQDNPPSQPAPPADWVGDFGEWQMFASQRDRVKQGLVEPKQLAGMIARAAHPKRWFRFLDAARRRF